MVAPPNSAVSAKRTIMRAILPAAVLQISSAIAHRWNLVGRSAETVAAHRNPFFIRNLTALET
jgi:hypothetical protein